MSGLRYVGVNPASVIASDSSVVNKGYIDQVHDSLAADNDYIDGAVADYASAKPLIKPDYVDAMKADFATKDQLKTDQALYVARSALGVANGAATLDANTYIPDAQLPTLVTENLVKFVPASMIYLTSQQSVESTDIKTYQAADLSIADPGYPYTVAVFGAVAGFCPEEVDHSRRSGGASFGKINVIDADGNPYAGGLANNSRIMDVFPVVPVEVLDGTPEAITGDLNLTMWLSLLGGSSYTYDPLGFDFWAMVLPTDEVS
ncbi:hypothetical protein [Mycolicibacter kumamotonensis]|uniref:Uncharacterized protein n=1 Tax=Mycolicibacter kumamotonensis TaxID=354243 RepID=A0A1B8SL56_9MYCO|nr:hypothetical protein [Mycolicibacter kumamotonensis]OBY33434.1 hypothetical protein ACT18_00305 [Mycolicibacter kumamotonensis]